MRSVPHIVLHVVECHQNLAIILSASEGIARKCHLFYDGRFSLFFHFPPSYLDELNLSLHLFVLSANFVIFVIFLICYAP